MMWLIAGRTGDPWWRQAAEHYSRLLEHRQHDRNVHDLGFIFLNTYLPWYSESGEEHLRQVLITAGKTLALRFNPKGQYLCSFVAPESLFIDIMMNVPLIFWAAREIDDSALHDLAVSHCRTTERTLVRPDGSTAHEGIFDLADRRVPSPVDPPGPACRLGLDPRPGLVALRLRHGLYLHEQSGRSRRGPPQCRLLPGPLPREPGSPLGLRRSGGPRPHRRQFGRRDRRIRLVEPGQALPEPSIRPPRPATAPRP